MKDKKSVFDSEHQALSPYGIAMKAILIHQILIRGGQMFGTSLFWHCPRCAPDSSGSFAFEYDTFSSWGYCGNCLGHMTGKELLFHLHLETNPVRLVERWLEEREHWQADVDLVRRANQVIEERNTLLQHGIDASQPGRD